MNTIFFTGERSVGQLYITTGKPGENLGPLRHGP